MSPHLPTNWTLKPAGPCGLMLEGTDVKGKPTMIAHLYAHTDSHEIDMEMATLIAAAPDLLANLKEVVEMWRRIYTNEYGTDEEACEHLAPMMAAIAKAEGRTP
jgi:hypothetical protein